MIKELRELQRSANATCVIVTNDDYKEISSKVLMNANVSNTFLFKNDRPPFADKIEAKSKLSEICYLVITEIDEISMADQEKFVGIVKDRELNGYYLPSNCIIVFTVKDRNSLKKISKDLYRFAVVAF